LDLCFVVVPVVGVDVPEAGADVVAEDDELCDLPPHALSATVLANTARTVSMALSGVLFMGRAAVVRIVGGQP